MRYELGKISKNNNKKVHYGVPIMYDIKCHTIEARYKVPNNRGEI